MPQIEKKVFDFLDTLPAKQKSQIAIKILQLFNDPRPNDSIKLKGGKDDYRTDIGEYRILYSFSATTGVQILKVGKRNDGEVYR
jgi:mRNA-degrading endonuclease RelE of RelBE toxin-antitoxin system